jgi:hypothetical protein
MLCSGLRRKGRDIVSKPLTDMRKIVKIARDAGYNGYLPIESLPMGRKNYDTPGELRRMLKELKAAIAE